LKYFGVPVTTNGTYILHNDSIAIESQHPYGNNTDLWWNFTKEGVHNLSLHFKSIETEQNYDHVRIYNSSGAEIASYSGSYSDFWTPFSEGNTITIRLISNSQIVKWGFEVDEVKYNVWQWENNITPWIAINGGVQNQHFTKIEIYSPSMKREHHSIMGPGNLNFHYSKIEPENGLWIVKLLLNNSAKATVTITQTTKEDLNLSGSIRATSKGAFFGDVKYLAINVSEEKRYLALDYLNTVGESDLYLYDPTGETRLGPGMGSQQDAIDYEAYRISVNDTLHYEDHRISTSNIPNPSFESGNHNTLTTNGDSSWNGWTYYEHGSENQWGAHSSGSHHGSYTLQLHSDRYYTMADSDDFTVPNNVKYLGWYWKTSYVGVTGDGRRYVRASIYREDDVFLTGIEFNGIRAGFSSIYVYASLDISKFIGETIYMKFELQHYYSGDDLYYQDLFIDHIGWYSEEDQYPFQNPDFEVGSRKSQTWDGDSTWTGWTYNEDSSENQFGEFSYDSYQGLYSVKLHSDYNWVRISSDTITVPLTAVNIGWYWKTEYSGVTNHGNRHVYARVFREDNTFIDEVYYSGFTAGFSNSYQYERLDISNYQGENIYIQFSLGHYYSGDDQYYQDLFIDHIGFFSSFEDIQYPLQNGDFEEEPHQKLTWYGDQTWKGWTYYEDSSYDQYAEISDDSYHGSYSLKLHSDYSWALIQSDVFTVPLNADRIGWYWKTEYEGETTSSNRYVIATLFDRHNTPIDIIEYRGSNAAFSEIYRLGTFSVSDYTGEECYIQFEVRHYYNTNVQYYQDLFIDFIHFQVRSEQLQKRSNHLFIKDPDPGKWILGIHQDRDSEVLFTLMLSGFEDYNISTPYRGYSASNYSGSSLYFDLSRDNRSGYFSLDVSIQNGSAEYFLFNNYSQINHRSVNTNEAIITNNDFEDGGLRTVSGEYQSMCPGWIYRESSSQNQYGKIIDDSFQGDFAAYLHSDYEFVGLDSEPFTIPEDASSIGWHWKSDYNGGSDTSNRYIFARVYSSRDHVLLHDTTFYGYQSVSKIGDEYSYYDIDITEYRGVSVYLRFGMRHYYNTDDQYFQALYLDNFHIFDDNDSQIQSPFSAHHFHSQPAEHWLLSLHQMQGSNVTITIIERSQEDRAVNGTIRCQMEGDYPAETTYYSVNVENNSRYLAFDYYSDDGGSDVYVYDPSGEEMFSPQKFGLHEEMDYQEYRIIDEASYLVEDYRTSTDNIPNPSFEQGNHDKLTTNDDSSWLGWNYFEHSSYDQWGIHSKDEYEGSYSLLLHSDYYYVNVDSDVFTVPQNVGYIGWYWKTLYRGVTGDGNRYVRARVYDSDDILLGEVSHTGIRAGFSSDYQFSRIDLTGHNGDDIYIRFEVQHYYSTDINYYRL